MNASTGCPFHRGPTPDGEDPDELAYQALRLCDIDGDEHTTAVILDCLHVGAPATPPAETRPVRSATVRPRLVS